MGKRYYCDYCERSFADGAENRKKHLASVHHQKLRAAHYEQFKDAATLLAENRAKKPCRKFHQTGNCDFGLSCKYSHFTPSDIKELEREVFREHLEASGNKPRIEPDIDAWVQTKLSKYKEIVPAPLSFPQPVLPSVLMNIPNLPPSLIPPNASDLMNFDKNKSQWG
ncbi:zinc finger matrin-type protein 5-like isoform X2 [Uloborus diversus]|uniref:zinc finger matrin-type protein 5-like isoform X2 n=1 Tax=Uloborus diversus TaxID=327109 RepID=UPI0024092F20|nr:zinc finger matrin-type protein 5-like isoform X2 [Uloborus diversus]